MEEVKICKKQFIKGNKFNFIMTIILNALTAAFASALAFILMYALEAIQDSNF